MHDQTFTTRIESAFRVLSYTHVVESGGVTMTPRGPQATQPRSLTQSEAALRNSAAEVLRNFITGEIRVPRARRAARPARPDITMGSTNPNEDQRFNAGLDFDYESDPDGSKA